MSVSTYKFLHKIVAPQLTDVNFGQNLAEQFTNINMNFQRLASASYLSGQQGNDVVIKRMDILYPEFLDEVDPDTTGERLPKLDENGNIIYSDVLTQFGADLINCITGSDEFINNDTLIDIDYGLYQPYSDDKQVEEKGFLFSESIKRNPYIDFFAIHDNDTLEDKLVCATQMYYFYDYRNGSLDLIDDVTEKMMDVNTDGFPLNDFNDYTCFIICTYADDEFKFEKSTHMPTLYFDSSRGEFCWKFNGIDSNITAQGVKGDKGDSARCWLCKAQSSVNEIENNEVYTGKLISVYDDNGILSNDFEELGLHNGDMCIIDSYVVDNTENVTYQDTIFGEIIINDNNGIKSYNVQGLYNTSIAKAIANTPNLLFEYLKKINSNPYSEYLHGLFIPSYSGTFANAINSKTVSNRESVIIHPVDVNSMYGNNNSDDIPTKKIDPSPVIEVDGYDVELNGKLHSNNTISSTNEISGKVGDDIVNLGVPVGTVIKFSGNRIPTGWIELSDTNYIQLTKMPQFSPNDTQIKIIINGGIEWYFKLENKKLIRLFLMLSQLDFTYDEVLDIYTANSKYFGDIADSSFPNLSGLQLREILLWTFDKISRPTMLSNTINLYLGDETPLNQSSLE